MGIYGYSGMLCQEDDKIGVEISFEVGTCLSEDSTQLEGTVAEAGANAHGTTSLEGTVAEAGVTRMTPLAWILSTGFAIPNLVTDSEAS